MATDVQPDLGSSRSGAPGRVEDDRGMRPGIQLACIWCGPIFCVVFFVGMLLAGLLPPTAPHASAAHVAHLWESHIFLKRLGLWLMLIAGGLTAPYGAMLCVMLRRIEGRDAPMTFLQAFGVALGVVAVIVPTMIFMVAAFRPSRDPGLLLLIDDLAWLPFVVNFVPAMMQCLSIVGAVFGDRSATPVFPRWVAYYNAWTAVLFVPGGLVLFFKHGPFAWDGLLAFWLAAVVFGSWFMVMSVMMMRAVKRHAAGELLTS